MNGSLSSLPVLGLTTSGVHSAVVAAVVIIGVIKLAVWQSRRAKNCAGETRSVSRAGIFAQSTTLQKMVEPRPGRAGTIRYVASHEVADVVSTSVDEPTSAYEEADMLDPHYRNNSNDTGDTT